MIAYLNYAGLAPLRPGSYWRGLTAAPELWGNMRLPAWSRRTEALREQVADWLGCQSRQVGFVPSTGLALTMAAHSLDWRPDDVALYPANDFPANVLPWQALSRARGVRALAVEDWLADWPSGVRMVSVSTVDYSSGVEQPWREIVARGRRLGVWTCVDAIQSAGVLPSWEPGIDFWCAGAQKWLASGLGLCVIVLSERVLDSLIPPFPQWQGLREPPLLESGLMLGHARAWELGWVTPVALARLEASLTAFSRMGWEVVRAEVRQRRDYLHEQLLELGFSVTSCPMRWSGIVSFAPGADRARRIVQDGYRRRIITALRGDCVRLSPHCFTPERQLRGVVRWLSHCAASLR